ncbi:MAG: molybdopterin oxidoreductase family protein [Pseudomonadota bacterium]|nr:molybdopterin oxidoreductase family protein [Pseudomonadota bacterium]
MPLDFVHSACPHDCPSTCALEVERIDAHRIGRVRGAAENSYTAGVVCAKVARYAERVHHPDRLTHPLRRVGGKGDGKAAFEPIDWDDALDVVAEAFERTSAKNGREAVFPYHYAGTMGLLQRDGLDRFRHALGYSRQYSTICNTIADAGWLAGVGVKYGVDGREMAESDLIIIWGGNPVHTQVNVMTHIAKARKQRGAKLIVIDPYRTPTAEVADIHIMPRPGTDGALAAAMINVFFRDGHADWDYMREFTDAPDELARHVAHKTPEWAAEITGLDAAEIETLSSIYAETERAFIRIGYGFTRSRNGAANMHAVTCLPSVTGKWKRKGAGALYSNAGVYPLDMTMIMGLDVCDKSTRLLDQSRLGPILVGEADALEGGPPVGAMIIQNTNPMVVCPELGKVHDGFRRNDLFVCVHEQFMTETAAMADIVLPATTFLEHEDLYIAGGHTHLFVTKAVIEPLGECRSNHAVLCGLAKRLGCNHPGFQLTDWEVIDRTLSDSGLPNAETLHAKRWTDFAPKFEESHFLQGFGHADRKFHFKPDWANVGRVPEGMPAMPGHYDAIEEANDFHPYRLVAAPARNFLNSSFTETPTSQDREGRPTALIHPDDCEAQGLSDGSLVRLGNARGSVLVHAKPFDGLQRGVIVVESLWPNGAFIEGVGINLLIGADAVRPRGGAAFHDTAIWLKSA